MGGTDDLGGLGMARGRCGNRITCVLKKKAQAEIAG